MRFMTLLIALLVLAAPAFAAEEGDVGCADVVLEWQGPQAFIDVAATRMDPGVSTAIVGHYLWIQYAHTASSTENVVSVDLLPDRPDSIKICTDYIETGAIEYGRDAGSTVVVEDPETNEVAVVPHSSFTPHPEAIDTWIAVNGLVIL